MNLFLQISIIFFSFAGFLFSADDVKTDTVAVIGKKVISSEEFISSYKEKLRKIGITDNGETRVSYLMNLVNDELLIAEAKNRGMDKAGTSQKEHRRIYLQELLNAYTLKYISPAINVTEDDLKELFKKLNTKIKVSHLYAAAKEKADSLYEKLMSGEKFEELAKENFIDPGLRNNGGSLGYISVDEMDPDFEKAVYSMKPGEISKPVKTVQGYSIIRVEDIKSNPLLTENEFLKAQERLKAFAHKRAFEDASKQFSQSLTKSLKVKFNNQLITKIFNRVENKDVRDFTESPSSFSEEELDDTVVFSGLGNWNLRMLISEMSMISDKQKKFIRTKENLEDVIAGLVNRKFIEQKAIEEKLDDSPLFQKTVQFNFDTYLLATIEDELKNQILISQDSIRSYYQKNINLFQTEPSIRLSSILVDNPLAADSIRTLLNSGIPFEELSKKYSIQEMTAEDGGDMGFFKKSELDQLAEEVFTFEIGQWGGPYINLDKIVFLKCTDKAEPVAKSFQETEKEIEKTLRNYEWIKVREKYTASLKNYTGCKLFTQKLFEIKI